MDSAIVESCYVGSCRVGVYDTVFDRILNRFKAQNLSANVTRRKLLLESQDSTTGLYAKSYQESTIEMVIQPRGASYSLMPSGIFAREDAVGLCADVVEVGDQIKTEAGTYYEVVTVKAWYKLDSFTYRESQLHELPFYEG